jgi:hypothetical protein
MLGLYFISKWKKEQVFSIKISTTNFITPYTFCIKAQHLDSLQISSFQNVKSHTTLKLTCTHLYSSILASRDSLPVSSVSYSPSDTRSRLGVMRWRHQSLPEHRAGRTTKNKYFQSKFQQQTLLLRKHFALSYNAICGNNMFIITMLVSLYSFLRTMNRGQRHAEKSPQLVWSFTISSDWDIQPPTTTWWCALSYNAICGNNVFIITMLVSLYSFYCHCFVGIITGSSCPVMAPNQPLR